MADDEGSRAAPIREPAARRCDQGDLHDPDGQERNETATERADRNWSELLQEMRVTQTGVQILSGFLLILPFQQRFSALSPALRGVFLVALALTTLTTAIIVAPVAAHRVLFRRRRKALLVTRTDQLVKTGLTTLALTIVCVVALVFGFVVSDVVGLVAGAVTLLVFVSLWAGVPLLVLRGVREEQGAREGPAATHER